MKTIAYVYLTNTNHIYYYNPVEDKTKDYLFKMNHNERIAKALEELKNTRHIAVYKITGHKKRLLYIKN